MSILFYDHLVNKSEINILIDSSEGELHHKAKAHHLVDDILHQGIIEFILQKLHPHQHQTFLSIVHERPYDPEIILYLKSKISPEIEEEIKDKLEDLVTEIRKDLKSK